MIRRFRHAGALVLIVMGAGFLLGPDVWRSSPSFYVVRDELHVGLRWWGAFFLALGIGQMVSLLRHCWDVQRLLAIVAAGVTMGWAMSFVFAAMVGKLTGISGIPLWAFFAFAQATQARRLENRAR